MRTNATNDKNVPPEKHRQTNSTMLSSLRPICAKGINPSSHPKRNFPPQKIPQSIKESFSKKPLSLFPNQYSLSSFEMVYPSFPLPKPPNPSESLNLTKPPVTERCPPSSVNPASRRWVEKSFHREEWVEWNGLKWIMNSWMSCECMWSCSRDVTASGAPAPR